MSTLAEHAIAIVGVAAILPDAPNAAAFWDNVSASRYAITDVDPERWDPALYFDADPSAPERTYSKIGGWVRDWEWDPLAWHLPIPPKVSEAMDDAQKWAVACTRMALRDCGWPDRPLDLERTAVVLGNAMAGELHYRTTLRLTFPELARELSRAPSYAALPADAREAIAEELHAGMAAALPPTTEDTMPGELGNCLAGRVANLFSLRGPNFVVDAACASALAAMDASIEGLVEGEFDAVVTGGIDRNMSASTFIKFCAIGALSATGTRPYGDGADGFVMGEGAALFVLKRLADAERDGDRVYAVIRGIAGSSDGKGKGITAPNPVGQKLAIERAWAKSGLTPADCSLLEGHGTSTRVGDVVELTSLGETFGAAGDLRPGSIPLGSVKSNIGHLKGAAGAAGMLKAALALHHKLLPPSLGAERPNPNFDWSSSPFAVNDELREWAPADGRLRVAGVSAFGFGGTNFHAVLEEYMPGRFNGERRSSVSIPAAAGVPNLRAATAPPAGTGGRTTSKAPLRGALVLGAVDEDGLAAQLRAVDGHAPAPAPPDPAILHAPERIAIDYASADELATKAAVALKALGGGNPAAWKALRARGIFRGSGPPPKVAFLYTGQGSQYANMLAELRALEPIVASTFAEADEVMRPLLEGRALSDFIFVDPGDSTAVERATVELMRTEITQPAVLTVDIALTRLLGAYGIEPDIVMGHSLGEYGALVAAGALPFAEALEAVSARGHEMASLDLADPGAMAAVSAPPEAVEQVIADTDGYVVLANVNSSKQVVLGGATEPVHAVVRLLQEQGHEAITLPVSHAFHTEIVAPASEPLRATLRRLHVSAPRIPVVANVDGGLYPTGPDAVERIIDLLGRQVASPVQFVAGLRTLWNEGARVFVETGPKRALQGFASDVLGDDEALNLHTNHPKTGDLPSFNVALCGLYAAGLGAAAPAPAPVTTAAPAPVGSATPAAPAPAPAAGSDATLLALGRVFADALERGRELLGEGGIAGQRDTEPVVITGAALGLPGVEHTFDDRNIARILHGEQFIDVIPSKLRHEIADRHITRLVKGDDGQARFEPIDDVADVIKLAARAGELDLEAEFGVEAGRLAALGRDTQLAIAAGFDALRDAGIPLIQHYKTTTTGSLLPDHWTLPSELQDDTGIVFASAFPGYDEFADELNRFWTDRSLREQQRTLDEVLARVPASDEVARAEIERRLHDLHLELEQHGYAFDRRFLFRVLSMGHSQFAEMIGARGPNTQINSACASTTQAVTVAEDWIRAGRCSRVIVLAADDATSDALLPWLGSGFLASGAAATDEIVEEAALPFDERRHGMLLGMGAAAFVVESADAARERGITPICEVLGAVTANSAFHGTRLDVDHIGHVMEEVVSQAEARGVRRAEIPPETVFVSHETYTPARGGSAAAEIHALRRVFGDAADQVVIANTKGYTGHPMGVGIEDVVAVKALETGIVPAVPNFRDVDPGLGALNLSKGGSYPVRYALRLAAGFGSQISMMLLRWTPVADGRRRNPEELGYAYRVEDAAAWSSWLARVSGQDAPQLEVDRHRLRVADHGPAAAATAAVPTPGAAPEPTPPAAPTPTAAPEPAPAAAAPEAGGDAISARVLAVVAEQTGYPTDLLDPELDLEADLGIDTVKQAEVFATIREAYGIPRDDNLKLRDYPTLNHVVAFVRERTGTPEPTPPAAPTPTAAPQPAPAPAAAAPEADGDAISARVLAVVAEQTGYPTDLLDPELDLEADLGIDTVKQAEVFATIREAYDIPRDDNLKLRDYPTLNHVVAFVRERTGTPEPTPPAAPTPTAAPQPAPAPAAAAPEADGDAISAHVLAVVAEQTGYPTDLLDPELDLEADLGIDTVKQAEVFATIREAYDIPRDDNLKLRDYPTLNHVVAFVRERTGTPEPTPPAAPTPTAAPQPAPAPAAAAPEADGDAISAAFPRRIPVPVLRPPLDRCVPTGVTLGPGTRVVVMPDDGGVAKALAARLGKLGAEVLLIDQALEHEVLEAQLATITDAGPIAGVFWLAALDDEGPIDELDQERWHAGLHRRVKLLATTMRVVPAGAFLVSATRLGGRFGYDGASTGSGMGGAVSGFTKALAREREETLVKVVDLAPSRKTAALADLLIEELLRDPGAVEVGYADDLRWTVALVEEDTQPDPGHSLGSETTFLVTGAAGSIVSAITADLAAASGGTFHLLDLVPAPDPSDPDLAAFATDRDGLKRTIADRMRERAEKPTPKLVERDLARIERARAALDAIGAIERAGGTAHWHQCDLTDAAQVTGAVERALETSGGIDVLLHCAGLEISHFLPDKPQPEYDLVFDVKADGWFHILHALGERRPRAAVVFSSIAGRFGNAGQTDYAAANDLLCKSVGNLRRTGVRGIAIDWTAWAGIGMATRGSIPKMMEFAGIDMLPPEVGVPVVRRELTSAGAGGEVVIAGSLGLLGGERHPTGGLDADAAGEAGPMSGRLAAFTVGEGLVLETDLDPARQAFLGDHRIDGTPVLPGVMGMEGFAEAAAALLPGWHVLAVEDVELLAPFKFYRDEPRRLELRALFRNAGDGAILADCSLVGHRSLPGHGEQATVHFTGCVRLSREAPEAPERPAPLDPGDGVDGDAVYRVYFHGPAYRVLERAWRENGMVVGRLAGDLPPDHEPPETPTAIEPRLIELCFQTAGIWELGTSGRMGLPTHVDRVLTFGAPGAARPLWAVVTPREDGGGVDADVVDENGRVLVRLEGYRTIELPGGLDEDDLAPIRGSDALMQRPFKRLAIVNRGEAAMRLIHAVRELNGERDEQIRLIALHTDSERRAMFVRHADEAVDIGPAHPGYLDLQVLERALVACGADAAWVGWGFVAEQPEFAELCERLGIVFVGPSAETMRSVGDKIAAKLLAEEAGVPVASWSGGPVDTVEDALRHAVDIGFPLMVKATAGGGGRGIRRVEAPDELPSAFESARAEARDAFGDGTVLLEQVISPARHVEVQVIADGQGTAWAVGVRDCSCQRRNQKVVEESGSPALTAEQEHEIGEAAERLSLLCCYRGAATVEFLYEPLERRFSFMEVNARLQVEHPVTEMTTGLDLVKLQLHVAAGGRLEGAPPPVTGCAIEARLNAEDPALGFAPAPGRIELLRLPGGPFLRVDAGVAEGDVIPPDFDSMIAKIIAWGRDRGEALARLRRALAETMVVIEGGTTNLGFLLELTGRPELSSGQVDTRWLDRLQVTGEIAPVRHTDVAVLQGAIELADRETLIERQRFYAFAHRGRPQADAPIARTFELRCRGEMYSLTVSQVAPTRYRIKADQATIEVDVERRGPHEHRLVLGDATFRTLTSVQQVDLLVEVDGVSHRISRDEGGIVRSLAPALVVSLPVSVGDEVAKGDVVAVVESMKMESSLVAPFHGRVRAVLATQNVQVGAHAPLVQLEPLDQKEPEEGSQRVTFTGSHDDTPGLRRLESLALGYDVAPAEAAQISAALGDASHEGPEAAEGERHLIELYTDIQALARPRHDDEGGEDLLRSPQEHFHAWLRSLDSGSEGLPDHFVALLERALAHYGVVGTDRTPALEEAGYRLFLAQQRSGAARAAVLAILDRYLARSDSASPGPGEAFRAVLDRLVRVATRRDPVLADVARECRWRFVDKPLIDAVREAIYEQAEQHLDRLAAAPEGPTRQKLVDALVACPRPLVTLLAERLRDADPQQRRALLEVMTRRFYRAPSLGGFEEAGGLLTARYLYEGRERQLLTAFIELDELDDAVRGLGAHAATLPAGAEISADLYAERRGAAPSRDETAARLRDVIATVDLPEAVYRIVVAIAVPEHGRGLNAVEIFTFQPAPGGFLEDAVVRGVHPMIAHRLHFWRLANFELDRLPSAEDIYTFHGVARENPNDERLFAMAEVRDLTPVRDENGRITALPEFEQMYVEALESLRHFQAHRHPSHRLHWNRVLLHVWPPIDLQPDDLARIVARLAPATVGLGIEMVLVRGRLRQEDGSESERVVRFFSPAGTGVVVEVGDPPTEPLHPMDEGARRVISARRRGMLHPAEVVKLLGAAFDEHDLDESRALVPVDRPVAMNDAGVVVGLVRNVTERHPEGMLRVALFGDPTKALGSLAEPECRRINAAIDLAEILGVPVEWFALSAGARIAMDSGTENMDWIAAVLRRIIEFTQAGGELNVVVTGVNVGAQPYWNAEATMLMHTRGILVMTPDSTMVLTGKQALDYSGGVSADDNFGIGGYERIMGPNGQAQYWAPDLAAACGVLLRYYDHSYVVPGERFPRRAQTTDSFDRDVRTAPHLAPDSDLTTVGDIFSDITNPERKKPFDIRSVMRAAIDADHAPLERWSSMRGAESAVVWDAHLGGWPVALLGLESRPLPRYGEVPADGPEHWTSGTLFPRSSKKVARAINAVGGRRPLVVLANLSGFDGSPESMREWQLEFGAEIGRAVVNFAGPIVFCVISRYHGGAFVVFSHRLNSRLEAVALEGARASVIGGAPAAAVVFARDVDVATSRDPRIAELDERVAAAEGSERPRLRVAREALWSDVRSEKLGEFAAKFDATHSVDRAVHVGSVHRIIEPAALRPYLIDAVERGMARVAGVSAPSDDGSRVPGPVAG